MSYTATAALTTRDHHRPLPVLVLHGLKVMGYAAGRQQLLLPLLMYMPMNSATPFCDAARCTAFISVVLDAG